MSWIEEIEVDEADGKLAEMYAELSRRRGKISNILKVHSLNPQAMGDHLDLYMTLMFGKSGLSRLEREAVAVVVSAANECEYCVNHHTEALRHYERLTVAPAAMTDSDLEELRAVELSDKDILDLTLIVGYFNFVNRIAVGLGVAYSAEELSGYLND